MGSSGSCPSHKIIHFKQPRRRTMHGPRGHVVYRDVSGVDIIAWYYYKQVTAYLISMVPKSFSWADWMHTEASTLNIRTKTLNNVMLPSLFLVALRDVYARCFCSYGRLHPWSIMLYRDSEKGSTKKGPLPPRRGFLINWDHCMSFKPAFGIPNPVPSSVCCCKLWRHDHKADINDYAGDVAIHDST